MEKLFLYNNKLTALPPSVGQLHQLRSLSAQENGLTVKGIPQEIRRLTKLEYLDLRFNKLEGVLPDQFDHLSSLKTLLLKYNKLTGIGNLSSFKVSISYLV